MKRLIAASIGAPFIALMAAVFSAALPGVAAAEVTLVWARGQDTDSLDPMRSTTAETWQSNDLIYSTLVEYDQGKIVPNLAESWTVSEDEREITFHIRKGLKCHDGTPFDAHDVKWMVDRMINPKDPHAMLGWFGPITELVVIDDLTVKFVVEKPWGPFLGSQALVGFIPCDSNDGVDTFGASTAVGTGPFMVKEWIKGDRMVLERNPNYVRYGRPAKNPGPPHVDQLVLRRMPEGQTRLSAIKTGEVHMGAPPLEEVEAVKASPEMDLITLKKTGQSIFFQFAVSRPPFNDERARIAVAHAVDPDLAIDLVMEGTVQRERCPLGDGMLGNDQEFCAEKGYSYDPERAKELLAELGHGPDNPMEVVLMTWIDDNRPKIAQVFQNQLAQVGINARLETMDIGTLNARSKQENEITEGPGSFNMMGWSSFDPLLLWYLWHSPGGYAGYTSPELDSMLDKSVETLDVEKRLPWIMKAQEYILKRAVEVPLYTPGWQFVLAISKNVEGFEFLPFARPNFMDVRLKQ